MEELMTVSCNMMWREGGREGSLQCIQLPSEWSLKTPAGGGGGIKILWGFVLSSCHCDPRQSTTHTLVLLLYPHPLKPQPHTHTLYKPDCV